MQQCVDMAEEANVWQRCDTESASYGQAKLRVLGSVCVTVSWVGEVCSMTTMTTMTRLFLSMMGTHSVVESIDVQTSGVALPLGSSHG